jgi:hypothetical protein
MNNSDFSEVNFHTQINTDDYIKNQRLYTEIHYRLTQEEKYGVENWQTEIKLYFEYLDKHSKYEKECEFHQKKLAQLTGHKMPVIEDKNPDHTYASRMTGISRDYVVSQFYAYYLRSNASMKPKDEDQEQLDSWDWSMR